MTDDELAAKCAERSDPLTQRGELLGLASERLYALSALCALRGASLAQAEREAEAVAASEPFGYFRALPMGWEDCAETDEGAIPLYEHPAPVASAAPECSASEVGIQTSEPRAWAHFVKNGNIRIWSSTAKEALRIAKENGIELTPLYTEPQPDRVAKLEAEVKWLRSQVSIEQDVARAAVYARIDAENERAEARAAAAPDLLEFAEEVRRSGDTRLASMAIAVIAKAKGALTANQAAIAAEREACASLCDRIAFSYTNAERCAALIRARGAEGGEKC